MSKLTFSLTEKDLQRYRYIINRRQFGYILIYVVPAVGIALILHSALVDILQTAKLEPANIYLRMALHIGMLGILYLLLLRFFQLFDKRWLDPRGHSLAPRIFRIDTKGITTELNYHKSFTDWRGVIEIQETKNYLLFYIDRMQAYQVPTAVFEKPEDATAFLEKARGYWQKAGGGAVE